MRNKQPGEFWKISAIFISNTPTPVILPGGENRDIQVG